MTSAQNTKLIDHKFRIVSSLGAGGFGVVYKAEDEQMSRAVAVKVLEAWGAPDAVRFDREAKALSRLEHPHIVQIFAYGRDESNKPYIVMQYLQGETLGQVIRREEQLRWERIAKIGTQICEALTEAHKHGIIHRDLKPDNIMLLAEPEPDYVKVLDFGLSAFMFETPGAIQKLTQTGSVVGTAQYLSPEQSVGQQADARSDVYSLGCLLYQALTGRMPFAASDVLRVLYDQVHQLPTRFEKSLGIPAALELVIFKALQKDPNNRFQSMQEFSDALSAVLRNSETIANLGRVQFPDKPKFKPNKGIALGITALTIAVAGLTIPHLVSRPNVDNLGKVQVELAQGDLQTRRGNFEGAFKHDYEAFKAAKTRDEKYQALNAIGRLGGEPSLPPERDAQIAALLQENIGVCSNEGERAQFQAMTAFSAYGCSNYPLILESLKSHPWEHFRKASDPWWRDHEDMLKGMCIEFLGLAYARVPKPDPKAAMYWLEQAPLWEKNRKGNVITPTTALAKLYIESGDPKKQQKGYKMLKDMLPFMPPAAVEMGYVREALGESKYKGILEASTKTDAEFYKSVSTSGLLHEWIVRPGELDVVYFSRKGSQSEAAKALTARYRIGESFNAATLKREIVNCENLLKTASDPEARANLTIAAAVGYADLGELNKTQALLANEQWQSTSDIHLRRAACAALSEAYIMSANPQPEKVKALLQPYAHTDDTSAHVNLLYGAALLITSGNSLQEKRRARDHLDLIMPFHYHELCRRELEFYKELIRAHNMLDLWKP